MSDYTAQSFVEAVFERLRVVDPSIEASAIPRLRTMLPVALESLAVKVSWSPKLRHLMRVESGNTFPVENGVAVFSASASLLLDDISIRSADIRTADGRKIQMLADRASLDQDLPDSFLFGAMDGPTFYTNAPDGDVTLNANFIKTEVSAVPDQLIPMLFDEMISAWRVRAAA